jgi:hypothetical protein
MHSKNLAVAAALVVMLVTATTTLATIDSVFAGKGGRESNQATSQVSDCGNDSVPTNILCQNTYSQIQGDDNVVGITDEQKSLPPSSPTGFTITGSGLVSSETILCVTGPATPDPTLSVEFSAQSDGTTSGTYTLSITDSMGTHAIREGVFTSGTTDGSTFGLSGENLAFCGDLEGGISVLPMSISGDCGDGVEIIYGDLNTGATAFTGNVECTLT